MSDNKVIYAFAGVAAIGTLYFILRKPKNEVQVVTSREYQPQFSFSVPPLDFSGLGTVGATPIQWPTTTGVTLPPILATNPSANDKCCSDCTDRGTNISSWSQSIIDALSLGPAQPYVNSDMLTDTERDAIQLGQAQVVYDPSSTRGFFVAILSNGYARTTGDGIIYQGALPVLPPSGPGG